AASWPVDPSSRAWVDGMVAAQVRVLATPPRSISPGEGPVPALAFVVPRNGRMDDVLQSVRVVNQGAAGAPDLAELRLWRDGGTGSFDAGAADDVALGVLVPNSGGWLSGSLNEGLGAPGLLLFVAVTTTPTARDSSTIELAVPLQGLQVASQNDGPIDG